MKTHRLVPMALGILLFMIPYSQAQNVLVDGNFDTTTIIVPNSSGTPPTNVWTAFQNAGTLSDATVESGVCNYQVYYGGYETWEVQLQQFGFPLVQGDYYRLSFDVKADADRWFGLYLGEFAGSWTSIIGWENYWQYATTQWQTISIDFLVAGVFPLHQFSLEIGSANIGMYFDNVRLVDIGPYPSIGILGSSLGGWDTDYDMTTADGIHYSLSTFALTNGRVKFRQGNTWMVNWGNDDFPAGTAYQDGPDIPVPNPGNYDILFNRTTGEYSFTCVSNCLPYIGIAGTAVSPDFNWLTDVNMITTDGVIYKLQSYWFADGEARFRQDDNDVNSWSNADFPTGVAIAGGPDIQVAAGNYDVSFNLLTGEYSFTYPSVGIVGSSLNGWDNDVVLQTTDGIVYTLLNYPFTDGEVKFRLNNSWDYNWGGYTFPAGYGIWYGPNIPVPAGSYDVTFNRITEEYAFSATTCPVPGIQCPYDVYAYNSPTMCGSQVYFSDVIPNPNCGGPGVTITQTAGLPNGSFFPVGATTNSYTLTNENGSTADCSFNVYVSDVEAPVISGLSNTTDTLWPPNHKMVLYPLSYTATDNCENTYCELYVYSNEPQSGLGSGDLFPDWEIVDDHTVWLRAERSGIGNGREYHILIICHDDSWNYDVREVIVYVPHDMRNPKIAIAGNDLQGEAGADIETNNGSEGQSLRVIVWPNPSSQCFNLEVEPISGEPVKVRITDLSGRTLSVIETPGNQLSCIGSDLLPGIYLIRVNQGTDCVTHRLVKQ